jgi:hypothetical protein
MAYGLLSKLLMGAPQTLQGPGSGVLAQLLSQQGMPMGGGTGQGDFPPPPDPASQMPMAGQPASPSGFSDLLSPEVALPMAGALMAGPTFGAGMGQALAGAGPALAGLRDKNRSKAYLSQNFPELAAMSDAGAPMDVLWKAALHKRGIGSDTTYSTPTLMTKPDGTQTYVMFGNDGSMKEMTGQGGLKPGKVTYRDAGTYTSVLTFRWQRNRTNPEGHLRRRLSSARGHRSGQEAGGGPSPLPEHDGQDAGASNRL